MSLGPKTKDAIRRVALALPHIFADDAGIPADQRALIGTLRLRPEWTAAGGIGDCRVNTAAAWAEDEISKAIDEDNSPTPAAPAAAKVVHSSVAIEEDEPESGSKSKSKKEGK